MSLDVYLKDPTSTYDTTELFSSNITHNLWTMAGKAGMYEALWRPHRLIEWYNIPEKDYDAEYEFEKQQKIKASFIIPYLEKWLKDMKKRRKYYEKFNSSNGWGMYEHFIPWIEEYLEACKQFPNSIINISR